MFKDVLRLGLAPALDMLAAGQWFPPTSPSSFSANPLTRFNPALAADKPARAQVSLTAAAAAHVKEYAKLHARPAAMRIGVRTSSCSAYAYTFDLRDDAMAEDHIAHWLGVKVIIDSKSHAFLTGTEIDYRREGIQEGFCFTNPNVKGTCGCGESFTV